MLHHKRAFRVHPFKHDGFTGEVGQRVSITIYVGQRKMGRFFANFGLCGKGGDGKDCHLTHVFKITQQKRKALATLALLIVIGIIGMWLL